MVQVSYLEFWSFVITLLLAFSLLCGLWIRYASRKVNLENAVNNQVSNIARIESDFKEDVKQLTDIIETNRKSNADSHEKIYTRLNGIEKSIVQLATILKKQIDV